jgi:hypothetical protein
VAALEADSLCTGGHSGFVTASGGLLHRFNALFSCEKRCRFERSAGAASANCHCESRGGNIIRHLNNPDDIVLSE